MLKKRTFFLLFFALPFFFGLAPSEEAHGSVLVDMLGKSLNFLILFGGLALLLAKPLRAYLGELSLGIEKTIRETGRAKKEAEARLAAIQLRLEGLGEEVLKIKKEGEEAGSVEKERILAIARREADRLKSFARQEIEADAQAAMRELREYAAQLAVSLAQARIQKRLTPELHSHLIDGSIEGLGRLDEKTGPR